MFLCFSSHVLIVHSNAFFSNLASLKSERRGQYRLEWQLLPEEPRRSGSNSSTRNTRYGSCVLILVLLRPLQNPMGPLRSNSALRSRNTASEPATIINIRIRSLH